MKKIIAPLVLMLSLSYVSALEINISTYSLEDLKYLSKQIQARIVELEKTNTQKCFVTEAELSLGDGEGSLSGDVKRLQDVLREKGYLKSKSTGYYGKLTQTALIAYQKSTELPQTGMFDKATREALHTSNCSLGQMKKEENMVKKEEKKEFTKEVMVEKKKEQPATYYSKVTSIAVTPTSGGVEWSAPQKSQYGYKVTWSKDMSPAYPPRPNDRAEYFGDGYGAKASLKAFNGSGTYYVRACEYLNGACGTYSNEVKVELTQ